MKRNIEFKDFEAPETIRKLIDRLTSKLEKKTGTFSPELVHLRLMVEQNSVRTLYNTSITLDLPGKTLAARKEQHDMKASIRGAFAEIQRQLDKYKAELHREHWKPSEDVPETPRVA
ncbi:MAG TPA: HPF/RaiA family ribosome-associated protein [Terriglobia bacterium]|nr:HPF/RaiA family ribosome-associated protein [Terriglobia bacterium]